MGKLEDAKKLLANWGGSDAKRRELERWVSLQENPERPASRGMLGDPRAASGAEAFAEVDRELPSTNPTETTQEQAEREKAQADKTKLNELVRQGRPKRGAPTPEAQLVEGLLMQQSGMDPAAVMREKAAMLRAEADEDAAKLHIKNLSKDPALLTPPEHWTEQSQLQPSIKDAIPGVGHQVWEEPSIQMFRRDMGSTLRSAGLDPDKVDESDPLFHRYADVMWAQRYKKAQERGENVVRRSMMKGAGSPGDISKTPGEFDSYGLGVLNALGPIIYGLDLGYTGGLATEAANFIGLAPSALNPLAPGQEDEIVQEQRDMRESTLGQVASFAGALLPGGLGGRLAGGLSRLNPAAVGAGLGSTVVRGAGIGGKAAAGETLIQGVVQNLGDLSRGNEPTVSLESMGERALLAGGLGSALGGVFSGIGYGADAAKDKLLKSSMGKDISTAEAAGIEQGVLGRSEPADVKAARQRTADAGLGGDVKSMASRELLDRMAQGGAKMDREAGKELAQRIDAYHAWQEQLPNPKQPITELTDATVNYMDALHDDAGRLLPGVDVAKVRKLLPQMFELEEVSIGRVAQMREAGWRKLPVESGSVLGVVMGKPRELTARQLARVTDELDEAARFNQQASKVGTAPKDRAARELATAARKVRDRFPPHPKLAPSSLTAEHEFGTTSGYSALNTAFSQARRDAGGLLEKAGLPRELSYKPRVTEKLPLDELKAHTDELFAKLSPEEQFAVQSTPHGRIKETPAFLSAMEKMSIKDPTRYGSLYRGTEMSADGVRALVESGEFTADRTLRTSYDPELAQVYPVRTSPGQERVVFEIQKADKGASLVSDRLSMDDFEEVLLPAGSKFKVVGHSVKDGVHRIQLSADGSSKSLKVAMTPKQEKALSSAIQNFRTADGSADSDEALLKVAKAAGVEEELKMWAGIMAANRVAGGTREGVALGGGGIRGFLGGSLPQLAVRSTKTLNRLRAEPLAHAPNPSAELRALLRRLRGTEGPKGPPAFSLLGMGSGGPPVAAALTGQERESEGIDPSLRLQVMGKEHLRGKAPALAVEEAGWLQKLAEAYLRSSGQSMPSPPPQAPPAPQAPSQEFE